MIHVKRPPSPPGFAGLASQELARAAEFFLQPKSERAQRRYRFDKETLSTAAVALRELFQEKCAFCEASVREAGGEVEHYRPSGSVAESPGHPGYWWLFADWDNLLLACPRCHQAKRKRFPLAEGGIRAVGPEDDLTAESPLLLNPCVDQAEEHLVFGEDGIVSAVTARGRATIVLLDLNRPSLVENRRRAAQRLKRMVLTFLESELAEAMGKLDLSFENFVADRQEFAAMKRQLIAGLGEALLEEIGVTDPVAADLVRAAVAKGVLATATLVSPQARRAAKATSEAFQESLESYSLADEAGQETFRSRRVLIESIKIRNIKAIETLDLDFQIASEKTPWMMLLGENATGKSTVLHSVALTLVGAAYFAELVESRGVHPGHYVRFGCQEGRVMVKLSGFRKPHTLVFRASDVEFEGPLGDSTKVTVEGGKATVVGKGWKPQTLLLGYGATRLLPRRESLPYGGDFARVDNLFDPFLPLFDADRWLLGLDETDFDRAAVVLKELLAIEDETDFLPVDGEIRIATPDSELPLKSLSDGYQSAIAMTTDILESVAGVWSRFEDAEGIVLLDEIGAHLHPRWKMQIVKSLRQALPGVQFLATTHQPLCLRGLANGETVVLRRRQTDRRITRIENLPDPSDLRVDQLLTSRFFGLLTTSDPELEALYDEYYHLKALGEEHLNPEQVSRFGQLSEELRGQRQLGANLREELMYAVVDELLARERLREQPTPVEKLKQEAVDRVRALWRQKLEL